MKLMIINGPNLNMLGTMEPQIYGTRTYSELVYEIEKYCNSKKINVDVFQANYEGAIIGMIQDAIMMKVDGIIINPSSYAYTSVAILDALRAVQIPTIEVHLSDVTHREDYRRRSLTREAAFDFITGEGFDGYIHAIDNMCIYLNANK